MKIPSKIFLLGMPGSGKSTLGRSLSIELGRTFIDLDLEIEEQEGYSIPEIFRKEGEAYFRQSEADILKEVISRNESSLIATGGGTPCFFDNMESMNASGMTIYLNVPVEVIVDRMMASESSSRPLLDDRKGQELQESLTRMVERRQSYYRQAHHTIESEVIALDDLVSILESDS